HVSREKTLAKLEDIAAEVGMDYPLSAWDMTIDTFVRFQPHIASFDKTLFATLTALASIATR
ncbi:hypothetical protein BVY03_00820, partial [bacterium K02(2017)]